MEEGLALFLLRAKERLFLPLPLFSPLLPTLAPTEPPPTQASKRRDEKLASLKSDFAYPLPLPSFLVLPQKKKKSLTLAPPKKKNLLIFHVRACMERTNRRRLRRFLPFFPFWQSCGLIAGCSVFGWLAGARRDGWRREREREEEGERKGEQEGGGLPFLHSLPSSPSRELFLAQETRRRKTLPSPGGRERARIRHAENKKNLSASPEWESA